MDHERATEIIQQLADGVNPYTGERFPPDSPYQQADTVRALYLALEGLDRLKRSKSRAHSGPPKAGKPWTEDEEKRILEQFDAKVDVEEIAKELERSKGSIWARLEKLRRVQRKDFPGSTPHPPRSGAAPEPTPPGGKDEDYPF